MMKPAMRAASAIARLLAAATLGATLLAAGGGAVAQPTPYPTIATTSTLTKSQSRCGTNHDAGASTEIAMISYRSLVEKGLTRTARAISSLGMANSCSGTS